MTRWIYAAALAALMTTPMAAQDKAVEVMQKTRAALGGAKLEQLNALALEGPFAREMGNRQVQGKLELTLQLPGKMHRSEDTEMMGGMSLERVSALNGDTSWEDTQNRGGMGGGMQIVMRGPGDTELNAEQIAQNRTRRLQNEYTRYLLAFLGGVTLQPTYVAVAEAPEGKADVVEVKNEQGQAVRLFIDQGTGLPLMLQFREMRPRMNFTGGPGGRGPGGAGGGGRAGGAPRAGGPPPGGGADGAPGAGGPPRDEMRRMAPPAPSDVTLYLADYKKVDGIMLPHRLTQAIDGKTVEEWTIEKARVNPTVKADLFEKK